MHDGFSEPAYDDLTIANEASDWREAASRKFYAKNHGLSASSTRTLEPLLKRNYFSSQSSPEPFSMTQMGGPRALGGELIATNRSKRFHH
jgi:hypothetical protein